MCCPAFAAVDFQVTKELVLVCGYRVCLLQLVTLDSAEKEHRGPLFLVVLERVSVLIPEERGKLGRFKFLFPSKLQK